jgi:hypothetical protein
LGQPEDDTHEPQQPASYAAQRPDAVMTLKIVDELLAGGHFEAARIAVKRALKAIEAEEMAGC